MGNAHHRHAAHQALHHRVPSTMRHEAAHRRVREHPHLVAPLHHHAVPEPRVRLGLPRRLAIGELGLDVLPDDAEVRPPALLEVEEQLVELLPVHPRPAPERDVHHGIGRLGIEPLHVLGAVLLEEAGLVAGRGHWANRQRVVRSHGGERAHLEFLARVDEHVCSGGFPVERVEQVADGSVDAVVELGGVGGLRDDGREVLHGQRREAREPHDERRVVAVVGHDAGVAVEEMVVDGQHGSRLDPVERGRHAFLARDVSGPREEHRVDDAGHGAAARGERVHQLPDAARARGVEGRNVVGARRGVGGPVVPVVEAVREREELEAAVAAVGRVRLRREHAAVRGHGGGERDERARRSGEQAPGEAERRRDVSLERVREHEEVRLRRHACPPFLRLTRVAFA
ncbi:hypothetical protein CFC21_103701 [Triticum aestivum]|uniref:Uncharacterized protein n=2 Tax=Triticum aestivum TaxID=4565 RepID=A0A3B6SFR0_WHEAT|nr:hypothetical protein CFC21_103701 [Triticum aestivum]